MSQMSYLVFVVSMCDAAQMDALYSPGGGSKRPRTQMTTLQGDTLFVSTHEDYFTEFEGEPQRKFAFIQSIRGGVLHSAEEAEEIFTDYRKRGIIIPFSEQQKAKTAVKTTTKRIPKWRLILGLGHAKKNNDSVHPLHKGMEDSKVSEYKAAKMEAERTAHLLKTAKEMLQL